MKFSLLFLSAFALGALGAPVQSETDISPRTDNEIRGIVDESPIERSIDNGVDGNMDKRSPQRWRGGGRGGRWGGRRYHSNGLLDGLGNLLGIDKRDLLSDENSNHYKRDDSEEGALSKRQWGDDYDDDYYDDDRYGDWRRHRHHDGLLGSLLGGLL